MELSTAPASQPTISIHNTTSPSDFHVTTPRLYISHQLPTNDAHCDLAVALKHSPSNLKYHPDAASLWSDREAARVFITSNADRMLRTGYGRYVVSLRTGGADEHEAFGKRELEYIGCVSMQLHRHPSVAGPLIPDVGFNFMPKYHGRGFASEAASCLMQYYRETKGIERFAGITDEVKLSSGYEVGVFTLTCQTAVSILHLIDDVSLAQH
jgi:RimJ/RimL family protein N-acetyltransferase